MDTDQKRKLACDSCKRKKLKCEWEEDSICIRCSRIGTECIPQPITQRKKREKKPNTYLSSLEDRLKRMEAALMKSTQNVARRSSRDLGDQAIVDDMSMLKIHDNGSALFLGSASGFSIFSPRGLKWIADKTGDDHFSDIINSIPHLPESSKGIFGTKMWNPLSVQAQEPFPPREVALDYITAYFNGFGYVFPLYDHDAFHLRFAKQYPVTSSEDPAWYANLNIVFAIGAVMKEKTMNSGAVGSPNNAASPSLRKAENSVWWKWFRNATSMFIDLQFREGSLGAVQALVGMSFLLQTLPDPNPCLVVSTAALRLAQAIGLHRNLAYLSLTHNEVEQRRNTFWLGFLVERGISFRLGRPSFIHEDDIGIDFPKATGPPGVLSEHLRCMSKLGVLQGRIYRKLYSAKSHTKSSYARLQRIGMLDEELQHWRDSSPTEIQPGGELKIHSDPLLMVPVLMMQFSYFSTLTIIHRVSNHHGPWKNKGDDPFDGRAQLSGLNPRVFAGGSICVSAARSVIHLINACSAMLNAGDLNVIRIIAYYPLTALLTLFANVLQNPWDEQALGDLELMRNVLTFVTDFFGEDDTMESEVMIKTFTEIGRLATEFVTRSRLQGNQGPKRANEESNPLASKHPRGSEDLTSAGQYFPVQANDMSINQEFQASTLSPFNGILHTSGEPSQIMASTEVPQGGVQFQPALQEFDIHNDPFTLLDDMQGLDQTQVFGSTTAEGTPATFNTTSAEQTPECNVDDLLMTQDGSWFFPIENPWDYMGNPNSNFHGM